jgi:hypothetical protein
MLMWPVCLPNSGLHPLFFLQAVIGKGVANQVTVCFCLQAVYVVGNMADLPGRKVSEAEARDWAAARCYPYIEVRS